MNKPKISGVALGFILSTRPKQWTKNLLVFMALLFTVDQAWDPTELESFASLFLQCCAAFALFSALSGAAYLVNDVVDVNDDRRHPRKRLRPIAAGALPRGAAIGGAAALAASALALSYVLEPLFALAALGYLSTTLLYSFGLKRVVLIDVFLISGGFILRAVAGAAALQTPISPWLYICTGLGALFIALAKRRSELSAAGGGAAAQRGTLAAYTLPMLDQFIAASAAATLVSYTLYTVISDHAPENHAMLLTVPFVAYGLFRYMLLVQRGDAGERPEDILFTDAPLFACVVLWLSSAVAALVVFRG